MEFDQISPRSMEFLANIQEQPDRFRDLSFQFIAAMESRSINVPEFEDSFDWINTSEKLSFQTVLANKLCVLDFFTYCCINCMHVLPDLHALEKKYSIQDGVAVVGVHSAKFQNEKLLSNILSAVLRYDINHPVVNDADAIYWNKMSIRCWPTFVIVSPEGKVLLYLVGEGHRNVLLQFVDVALNYYKEKDLIKHHPLPIKLAKDSLKSEYLRYPGKLAVSQSGEELAIADTGHHKIAIVNKNGMVTKSVGNGKPGLKDGSFQEAQFFSPQGLFWHEKCIYVADTENHAIRKIDVESSSVSTITGTGIQGNDKEGGKIGIEQEISSPWDVVVYAPPGSDPSCDEKTCLYIAMAGTHQIWCFYLQDGGWLKKGTQKKHTSLRFAGSGNEENRNNSYPHKASFAQPSGLTVASVKEQKLVYVADSESSSVRSVDIKTGAVKACVGGERDPTNLFAYGDEDGKSVNAKLQHPLAVAYNHTDGFVYVADSYNHKIKVIDPVATTCTTLAGCGKAGYKDGAFTEALFNEPGDLQFSPDCKCLYVADTNNHKIRVLDMQKKNVSTLTLLDSDEVDAMTVIHTASDDSPEYKTLVGNNTKVLEMEQIDRDLSQKLKMNVEVALSGLHFTNEAESRWQVTIIEPQTSERLSHFNGSVNKTTSSFSFTLPSFDKDIVLKLEMLLYVCTDDNMCLMKTVLLHQKITFDPQASSNDVIVKHIVNL